MSGKIDWRTVRGLATRTRNHVLDFSTRSNLASNGFPCHSTHLACWCAISSMVLKRTLAQIDIEATVVSGHFDTNPKNHCKGVNHTWLNVDGKIVDITVSQFSHSMPSVAIFPKADKRWLPLFVADKALAQFSIWPRDQSPTHKLRNKVNKINLILKHQSKHLAH